MLARDEGLVHLGHIAWAMADAGVVLVTAVGDVDRFDLDRLRGLVEPHQLFVVGLGKVASDIGADLALPESVSAAQSIELAVRELVAVGVLADYEI